MRGMFGLLALVIVLGVVAVSVKQQLTATRVAAPSTVIAPDGAASGAVLTLPVGTSASAAQQYQQDMKDALQKAVDQRGRGVEGDGGR